MFFYLKIILLYPLSFSGKAWESLYGGRSDTSVKLKTVAKVNKGLWEVKKEDVSSMRKYHMCKHPDQNKLATSIRFESGLKLLLTFHRIKVCHVKTHTKQV